MPKHQRLSDEAVAAFLASRPGWERAPGGNALLRTFAFDDYAAGIAFVVRVGFLAEARDHHPDLQIGWRRVKVVWSTHDIEEPAAGGGISALDTSLAEETDRLVR